MGMLTTTTACSLMTSHRLNDLYSTLHAGRSLLVLEVSMGCCLVEHERLAAPDLAHAFDQRTARSDPTGIHIIRSDLVGASLDQHLKLVSSHLSRMTRTMVVLQMPLAEWSTPDLARAMSDEDAIGMARDVVAEHGIPPSRDLATLLPLRAADWPWRETRAEVARIRCLLGTARQDALDEVAAALVAGNQGAADILAAFGRSTLADQ